MRIVEYTITDLKELLTDELFWEREVLPITKHRLISQINNPRAKETDLTLVVAYKLEDDTIIGYLGVFPDRIFLKGVNVGRFAWMSCWWVHPEMNNQGIGSQIMQRVENFYDRNLGAFHPSDMTANALIKKGKYFFIDEPSGIAAIFNFNFHYLLQRKVPFLKKITFLLKILDNILNFLMLIIFFTKRKKLLNKNNYDIEYIHSIDNQTKEFIEKINSLPSTKQELFKREAIDLDWIIKYPWVLSTPFDDRIKNKYYFSSLSKEFRVLSIKIFNSEKNIIGFLLLKIRDNELTIPYCFFEKEDSKVVLDVIIKHIIKLRVDMIYFADQDLKKEFDKIKFPVLHRWESSRTRFMSHKFEKFDMSYYKIQDGDADAVFF